MTMPNLDQTEGIWILCTSDREYSYVQDVFPGNTQHEQWHRTNCQLLIAREHLQPELVEDRVVTPGVWDQTRRYRSVHT